MAISSSGSSTGDVDVSERSNGVDEEAGIGHSFDSDASSTPDDEEYFQHLDEAERNNSGLISNVSESEYLDQVSEMTPLVGDGGGSLRASPSYGLHQDPDPSASIVKSRPTIKRSSSEESITTVTALPGMTIRSHAIHQAGGLRGEGKCSIRPSPTKVALKAVLIERRASMKNQLDGSLTTQQQSLPDADSTASPFPMKESYWIDIETPQSSSEDLFRFLKQLRLPPFFISILSDPSSTWSSEVVSLKRVTLATFQILPVDPESDEITHVALLTMPKLLVTFSACSQNETEGLYQLVSQYMRQRQRLPEPTSTGALIAWIQFHVRRTSRAIRELRQAVLAMDEELDRDFAGFDFDDIIEAKNCLLRVLSVAEEQHGTIEALAGAEGGMNGLDFSCCRGALSVLVATSASNERLSSRVDKHLNELRERIMTHREDTLNRRLGLLTLLSAIFMPLTLLTGIWGMNFENMPELTMEDAYPFSLMGMVLLSLCMVYSFHRYVY